nr:PREDICTED: uncharacterized protein LOC105669896 [Linepithema humile]
MREARGKIDLGGLGIGEIKFGTARTGATLLEVPGPDSGKKADALAEALKKAFQGKKDVRVERPIKMGELRIRDLHVSIDSNKVAEAVAEVGGCPLPRVRVGPIRPSQGGSEMGVVCVRCPLDAAIKVVAGGGRIKVGGWAIVGVSLLEERPLQCFKCLGKGHVRVNCTSSFGRSGACYRCGSTGHIARDCKAPASCPVCRDKGLPHAHRVGGSACKAPSSRGRTKRGVVVGMASAPVPTSKSAKSPGKKVGTERKEGKGVALAPTPSPEVMDVEEAGTPDAVALNSASGPADLIGEKVGQAGVALDPTSAPAGRSRSTCVRTRGESIVDLMWASPTAARRVTGWWVEEDLESGSDHRYIVIEASTTPTGQLSRRGRNTRGRGWVLRKMENDVLIAVVLAESWPMPSGQAVDLEEEATRIVSMVEDACEASMPRSRWSPGKAMYWWTGEIAELRRLSSAARRIFLRARRRGDHAGTTEALEGFRAARKALRAAIGTAKARAWEELTSTLDRDPWGLPFKIVLRKLRLRAPRTAERLKPELLGNIVNTLFPVGGSVTPPPTVGEVWPEEPAVSTEEMSAVRARLGGAAKAPGPDGIPGRAWALVAKVLSDRLGGLFTACLRSGTFPSRWRRANLVLLHKDRKPPE